VLITCKTNKERECFDLISAVLSQHNTAERLEIDQEIRLLREIKEIIDELKIILMVFDEQIKVLYDMKEIQSPGKVSEAEDSRKPVRTVRRF
jgi:archaellum component FlaC